MPDQEPSDHDDLKEKLRAAFGHDADDGLEKEKLQENPLAGHDLPDTSDIDQRLKAMVSKTEGYKERKVRSADELAKARKDERADARGLGMGLQIAYTIIGFPLLGFGAGAVVDAVTKANIWKGFLGMAGCILAIFTAIILINRANSET